MIGEMPRREDEQILEPKSEEAAPEKPEASVFEKSRQALDIQTEQANAEAIGKGYSGILSKLSEKGRKIAGITMLSILPAIASGCIGQKQEKIRPNEARITQGFESVLGLKAIAEKDGSFTVKGERGPSFKVKPDSLEKMEKIRKRYEDRINKARGNRRAVALLAAQSRKELMKIVRSGEKVSLAKTRSKNKQENAQAEQSDIDVDLEAARGGAKEQPEEIDQLIEKHLKSNPRLREKDREEQRRGRGSGY